MKQQPDKKIFVDLDGVLADFSKGVRRVTGQPASSFSRGNIGAMWSLLRKEPDFFNKLDWMPQGKKLWATILELAQKENAPVIILTGLPHGDGWSEQKYRWVSRELGYDVPFIVKHAHKTKLQAAFDYFKIDRIPEGEEWILIDDTLKNSLPWVAGGGEFIHHKEGASVEEFLQLWNQRA